MTLNLQLTVFADLNEWIAYVAADAGCFQSAVSEIGQTKGEGCRRERLQIVGTEDSKQYNNAGADFAAKSENELS